jgi:hypothetical protein
LTLRPGRVQNDLVNRAGVALVAVLLSGPTLLGADDEPKPRRVCVNRRDINVVKALDDQHAFVKAQAARHYLFTLDKACHAFKFARRVSLDDSPRVCSDGLTLISFEDPSLGPLRCRIVGIDAVPDETAARELIESRAPPQ